MSTLKKCQYFGTDGVRGLVGEHPLTPEFVLKLGFAAGKVFSNTSGSPTFMVGRDTRQSGEMLGAALTAGLLASGATVVDLGVITTPGVAFMVKELGAEAGVVISASHNPVQENGIKFFDANAHKLDETIELAIETLLDEPMHLGGRPGRNFGHRVNGTSFREQYVRSLVEEHPDLDLSGIKLVLDCANGAASWYAPEVFSRLGAEVIVIHASPTGQNINENAGSEHVRRQPEDLFEMMKVHHANFGIVFDGDADRVIFVDENGNLVDGDHMLAILADFLSKQGKLLNNTVVSTTMRNGALVNYFAERKIKFIETPVGDKYIMTELMGLKRDSDTTDQMGLGGEQSGHIILMDAGHATGDGIRSAIYLIRAFLASHQESLLALAESIHKYPQVIASARVAEKIPLDRLETVQVVQQGLEESLPGLTRLNLRYSGTEPKVRLMLEADNRHTEAELAAKAFELCESVQEATGTPKGSFLEVLNVTRGGLVERGR